MEAEEIMAEPIEARTATQLIETSLSYIKEGNSEVQELAKKLLDKIGDDLDDLGYDPGQSVIDAYTDLTELMDSIDAEGEEDEADENDEEEDEVVEEELDEGE